MAKVFNLAVTPRLRFPKFRAAKGWRVTRAGNLFSNRNERGEAGLPLYSVTIDEGLVKRSTLDRKIDDISVSEGNKKVQKGDVAYNMMRMWQGAFGIAVEDCMVSPAYIVLKPKDRVLAEFFCRLFKSPQSLRLLISQSHGLTKDRLRLYFNDFAQIPLPVPPLTEQKKIVDCLSSLDAVIAAQERKINLLKDHKRSLMRLLFPREAETLPRTRFPQPGNENKWKRTSLGQIVDFQSGSTPSKANPAFWNGSIPWVSAKDMKQLFLDDTKDHITTAAVDAGMKQVPPYTVLMLTRGMTLLHDVPICIIRREMSFNQDVKALRPKGSLDEYFLPYLLQGNKAKLLRMVDLAGHGTGRLDTEELKALDVMLPPPAEQRRIADCLYSLDRRIHLESEKFDALKAHHRGLMQQLFPSREES